MKRFLTLSAIFVAASVFATVGVAKAGEPDWSKIDEEYIDMFYPGQSAWEWLSSEHKGKKAILRGNDKCIECHQGEEESRGKNFVTGKKLEDDPPPSGTPGMMTTTFKGAYDSEYMYLRFEWEGEGKATGDNIISLNFMIDDTKEKKKGIRSTVKYFEAYGCWITCHRDATAMPYQPKPDQIKANPYYKGQTKVTKYLIGTRTKIDSTGGWADLKEGKKLKNRLKKGKFIDLWRFIVDAKSPKGRSEDAYIFGYRGKDKTQDDLSATGEYKDGKWVVVLKKKLNAGDPKEDKIIKPGKRYAVAVSIHNNSINRRHYAAFSRLLGFDDDGEADLLVNKQ